MKYRKKPVIIEAEEYKPGMEDGFVEIDKKQVPYLKAYSFLTLISPGDFIVDGILRTKDVMSPERFHEEYEPVEE